MTSQGYLTRFSFLFLFVLLTSFHAIAQPLSSVAVLQMSKTSFVTSGGTRCAMLTLSNVGDDVLIIQSINWQSQVGYQLSSQSSFPLVVASGQQRQLEICYDGSEADLPFDTLNVISNSRQSIAWGVLVDASRSMDIDSLRCAAGNVARLNTTKDFLQVFIGSITQSTPSIGIQDRAGIMIYSSEQISTFPRTFGPVIKTIHSFDLVTEVARMDMKREVVAVEVIGGTMTGAALSAIIDSLNGSPYRHRKLLLITDGETDDISEYPVMSLIQQAKDADVQIIGVGIALDDATAQSYLDAITTGTGGEFFAISSCEELDDVLAAVAKSISKKSLIQEPFPAGSTLSISDEVEENGALSITGLVNDRSSHALSVEFQVRQPIAVMLSLYNIKGEQMQKVDKPTIVYPGGHRLTLETEGISPGLYLVVLQTTTGESIARKVVVE